MTVAVLTPEEIRTIVEKAMREAIAAHQPNDVMDRSDVARLLKVNEKTVNTYVEREGLPGHRLGREWRFFRHEVMAWLKERKG